MTNFLKLAEKILAHARKAGPWVPEVGKHKGIIKPLWHYFNFAPCVTSNDTIVFDHAIIFQSATHQIKISTKFWNGKANSSSFETEVMQRNKPNRSKQIKTFDFFVKLGGAQFKKPMFDPLSDTLNGSFETLDDNGLSVMDAIDAVLAQESPYNYQGMNKLKFNDIDFMSLARSSIEFAKKAGDWKPSKEGGKLSMAKYSRVDYEDGGGCKIYTFRTADRWFAFGSRLNEKGVVTHRNAKGRSIKQQAGVIA